MNREVSAVIVTRGDVDLEPIIATIPLAWDLVVWDNSKRDDLGVYGRYAALEECEHDVVYVQDDDCVTDPVEIASAYEPGRIVSNMPHAFRRFYPHRDSCLLGFGAVFDRDLPVPAFKQFWGAPIWNPVSYGDFCRTCDVVFAALVPHTRIDVPYENLPHATAPERMYQQPGHSAERRQMLKYARQVRRKVAA